MTTSAHRSWVAGAVQTLEADATRSADTNLQWVPLREGVGITLYLKDESTHPSGSLKHRLARSLFLHAICNGWVGPDTTIVEASSGSTAISEAYFAKLLRLQFIAVAPRATSPDKLRLIQQLGGACHLVDDPATIYAEAARIARERDGHYLDQFTYAERATDWRGNNNIAESIFEQMALESHPVPSWIVVGAGTGGTAATIGRFLRFRRHSTQLCVVDPEGSSFYEAWRSGDLSYCSGQSSRIEGIGRPRVEPSFVPAVVDQMYQVPDGASVAAMNALTQLIDRRIGPSTGTNLVGALLLAKQMREQGQTGSIVTLICDSGDRYAETYYNPDWLSAQGIDPLPWAEQIEDLLCLDSSMVG